MFSRRDLLKFTSIALPVLPFTKWMKFKPDVDKDDKLTFHFGLIECKDKVFISVDSTSYFKHEVIKSYINNYHNRNKTGELKDICFIFYTNADKFIVGAKAKDEFVIKAETFYTEGDFFIVRNLNLNTKETKEDFEIRVPYSTWIESKAINGSELFNYLFAKRNS